MRNRIHLNNSQDGASLVEFSIAGTVFFLSLFGVLEVSRLLWVHNTLTEAVRSGSRYAVLNLQNEANVKNYVVYGNPIGGTTPVAVGLTTNNVFVTYSNFGVKSGTVTVEIRNYTFTFSIPMIGNTVSMPTYKSTMTGESAGSTPTPTVSPTPTPSVSPTVSPTATPTATPTTTPTATPSPTPTPCPNGYSPNASGTGCGINCPNGYSPNAAGNACVINCPSGYSPNAAGNACVINCASNQIPASNGTSCQTCPSGTSPNATQTACVCPNGQPPNNGGQCPNGNGNGNGNGSGS